MSFFPAGTYDLFLTHAWCYTDDWQGLVAMLDEHLPGRWRNWSLPWHDTSIERYTPEGRESLVKLLHGHISMASAVLLLPEIKKLPEGQMWLDKQLEIAVHYSKPIIGVLPQGEVNSWFFRGKNAFPEDLRSRVQEITARNAIEIIKRVSALTTRR
jgi:hypothetical protein